jgi:hypothetical protein
MCRMRLGRDTNKPVESGHRRRDVAVAMCHATFPSAVDLSRLYGSMPGRLLLAAAIPAAAWELAA